MTSQIWTNRIVKMWIKLLENQTVDRKGCTKMFQDGDNSSLFVRLLKTSSLRVNLNIPPSPSRSNTDQHSSKMNHLALSSLCGFIGHTQRVFPLLNLQKDVLLASNSEMWKIKKTQRCYHMTNKWLNDKNGGNRRRVQSRQKIIS